MQIIKALSLGVALNSITLMAFSDTLTAEIQTRLNLLGYNAGPVDGLTGGKTNSAISAYRSENSLADMAIDALAAHLSENVAQRADIDIGTLAYQTTSNFTEMSNNEAYFLMGDPFETEELQELFGENGIISKWYFANVTGDATNELVVFGINNTPLVFLQNGFSDTSRLPQECESGTKIYVFEKVDENWSGDFRYRRLNENDVFGPDIRSYGDTFTITSDLNGDGYNDFYIPSESDICASNQTDWFAGTRDVLLISNNGDGYIDVTDSYSWLSENSFRHWAAGGDIDNDGDVDLLTSHLGMGGNGNRVECFINDGSGQFEQSQCVSPPASMRNPLRSWGGGLIDLNNDGNLDLIYTGVHQANPVIMLGDGSGTFSGENYVDLFLPSDWPRHLQQFGSIWVADVDSDGWQDLLVGVQGVQDYLPAGTACRGYCGTGAGWFRNVNGFLDFQEFFLTLEPDARLQWASVSLFSVGDYVRERDEPRNDIWLRRHYYGTEPFFQFDEEEGGFRPTDYVYLPRVTPRDLN